MEISSIQLQGVGMASPRSRSKMVLRLREAKINAEAVLQVMETVPRHLFVEPVCQHMAYTDRAVPIGFNQTISQPYTVALMTQTVLQYRPQTILEIGTGSGYQTAVFSALVPQIYSVERIAKLQQRAREILQALKITNVEFAVSDGFMGWPKSVPQQFDAISVAAAPEQVPQPLLELLAPKGILLLPIGDQKLQKMCLYQRCGESFTMKEIENANFVPMLQGVQK